MSTGLETIEDVLPEGTALQSLEIAARSPFELFWRRLKHDKFALGALVFIGLLILIALLAGPLVKLFGAHPPNQQNSKVLILPFGDAAPPSSDYWFGTDGLGRDVLSRTLVGARVSLLVAFVATALTVFIGVTFGMKIGRASCRERV